MKTVKNYLGALMLVILVGGIVSDLQAQGRGRGNGNPGKGHNKENHPGKGHDKHRSDTGDKHDRYDNDRHDSHHEYARNDRDNNYKRHDYSYNDRKHTHYDYYRGDRYYSGKYVTYNYHRHGPPSWAPAYGYRYNTRYIYYRDYNVYYDCHRDVFITWTGRNWVITTQIPDVICHVDFNRAVVVGVDYWNDDFDFYLTQRRPTYVSISASW